ncbi:putative ABC transport system permease protein [Kribbella sp. VKM Ac-2527]|uniref:Putative ABC transport system permease protein n=1 Tax=Kribbella caucasensis TaxID=2512215 RepID=A0A4R6KDD0_9ACTN|nr:iron export ABC transporter permease subunit FetB [Kribbella sp. VKM Ac-2527]TDO48471.1 putative ABC transport system permease protein [Kribbella sp. VKM Ac-2527]
MNAQVPSWAGVATSAALVVVCVLVVWRQRLGLSRDVLVAAVQAAIQLVAIGAVLLLLFRHTGLPGAIGWLALMVVIAGQVAGRRARGLPQATWIATAAVGVGTAATLGVLLATGVIAIETRVVIPVGGMVVANAMQTAALVLSRLREEARTARPAIEARLALGLPAREAFAPHHRSTLRYALIPAVDSTRVVGLISLPGAMTGLILAGVDPLTAIRYQIVVMYMLLAADALAALIAARLSERALFDQAHRLRQVATP